MSPRDPLAEALKLPPPDRGQLIEDLIRSLDEGEDDPAKVEQAWAKEIERRAIEARTSGSATTDLGAFCDELDARRKP